MAKLSERERAAHQHALQLLQKDTLTEDERETVLEGFHEQADHHTDAAGAWFTPPALAREFRIEVTGRRIIDLCAGIGTLSFMARPQGWGEEVREFVCIERNPRYVEIGRKILPEATWICGDVFELAPTLGRFDCAISNPPYGRVRNSRAARNWHGRLFEWKIAHLASTLARDGVFLMPQQSAGFIYSGSSEGYQENRSAELQAWMKATGLTLRTSCGIDISDHAVAWKPGTPPPVEIVCCDFEEQRREAAAAAQIEAARAAKAARTPQPDLFAA